MDIQMLLSQCIYASVTFPPITQKIILLCGYGLKIVVIDRCLVGSWRVTCNHQWSTRAQRGLSRHIGRIGSYFLLMTISELCICKGSFIHPSVTLKSPSRQP